MLSNILSPIKITRRIANDIYIRSLHLLVISKVVWPLPFFNKVFAAVIDRTKTNTFI